MLIFLSNLDMGAGEAPAPPVVPVTAPVARGRRRQKRFEVQYVVEVDGEKHYFLTEAEAESFLRRSARTVIRRAKAISRTTHRIVLPNRTLIPLPQENPLPRFIVEGGAGLQALSDQINAQINQILSNPDFEADLDDEDIMRLLQ